MLIVVIGLSGRTRRLILSAIVFIPSPFRARCLPRGNHSNSAPLSDNMNNKKQRPILGQSNDRFSLLILSRGVGEPEEWVKEYLACLFKPNAMLFEVGLRLVRIPMKSLARVDKVRIHLIHVYKMYIRLSSGRCFGGQLLRQ